MTDVRTDADFAQVGRGLAKPTGGLMTDLRAAEAEAPDEAWHLWRVGHLGGFPREAFAAGFDAGRATEAARYRDEAMVCFHCWVVGANSSRCSMTCQKDEAVGKAMWAALDQIDNTRAALKAALIS